MEDLNDKVTGNTLTATEWNQVPSEIQNVIEGLGITLSNGDLNQLGKAIAGYVANGDFYTDSGAANAYVLSAIGSKQSLTAYTDGMKIRFVPGNANTGASTVNVAGLGVKSIKVPGGADPAADVIITTRVTEAWYSASAGYFILTGDLYATTTYSGDIRIATDAEVQTGTAPAIVVTPAGLASFGKSLTASGYQKFPGGLIIQWGAADFRITPISYPITFPNDALCILCSQNAVAAYETVAASLNDSSSFTAYSAKASGTDLAYWLAIGY